MNLKQLGIALGIGILVFLGLLLPRPEKIEVSEQLGVKVLTDRQTFLNGFDVDAGAASSVINGDFDVFGDTTVEEFTTGGGETTLTDANGGTYTLTEAEMLAAGTFKMAAGGAGQEVIALTLPATSTMTTLLANAGDCREWIYDASALAAATTTTITAGTGHHIIAYTTNDDVIDGLEFSQIKSCRRTDTDVNTFVSEMLHAD